MPTKISWLDRILGLEPVLTRGAIVSVVGVLGMVLNLNISDGVTQKIVSIVIAAFALLGAAASRSAVTPNNKVAVMKSDETTYTPVMPGDPSTAGPAGASSANTTQDPKVQ